MGKVHQDDEQGERVGLTCRAEGADLVALAK